ATRGRRKISRTPQEGEDHDAKNWRPHSQDDTISAQLRNAAAFLGFTGVNGAAGQGDPNEHDEHFCLRFRLSVERRDLLSGAGEEGFCAPGVQLSSLPVLPAKNPLLVEQVRPRRPMSPLPRALHAHTSIIDLSFYLAPRADLPIVISRGGISSLPAGSISG